MISHAASPIRKCLIAFTLAAAASGPIVAGTRLASRGRASARIVVAAGASETERFAADELALFLHIVTGARFPVVDDAGQPGGRLLVGPGAAKDAARGIAGPGLAPEEIVVRTVGDDIVLAGGSPRATLYAVYSFLEDVVGCRWWTGTASRMPWKPSLSVGKISIRFKPPLEYREPYWHVAFDHVWAARNKANGTRAGGDALRGGRQVYEGFVHTFYGLIPPEKYFEAHPDWFSEIDGRRTFKDAQLCLTNEDMRRELVKNLKERLRANPAATIASVSQNDCFGNCTCPKCRAVDEEEGGPAGSLLRFVNAVAADIEPEFPGYRHRHPGLPVHAEAAPPRPAEAERHRAPVQHRMRLRANPSTIRATRPSSTTSTAGRRSPGGSTSGTTRRISRTMSSPTPITASWPPTSASSSTGTSAAYSSRAPISPGVPRWPSSGPGSWPSCSGIPGSRRAGFAKSS